MAQKIEEIMTRNPIALEDSSTALDAARAMRDADIGDVIVTSGGAVHGILTDRDIVVRAVAEGREPSSVRVGDICSSDLVTVSPGDDAVEAVEMMRQKAIRRLPVVENGNAVGILSIGDLAIERDSESALSDISAARPNN
ncbi:MAG: CBS domain-containing protein [Dehalococcoidia bacterium]